MPGLRRIPNSTLVEGAKLDNAPDDINTEKQDTLVSWVNIKTIELESILWPWNIEISGISVNSVNTKTGDVVIDPDDLDDAATANKFVDATERTNIWLNDTHRWTTTWNPHSVTATEVWLGNVNNTADANQTSVWTVTVGNVDTIVAKATSWEINTGTNAVKTIAPDQFAWSNYGKRIVQIYTVEWTTDVATGDGQGYIRIPVELNGWNLVWVACAVITAGTTGTTDVQIHNVTQAADTLSTKLTIDTTETDSSTAATPAVIDTANDDVATADQIRIDVDAVSTTAPKWLIIELTFQLP